ncbi:MAG: carboxypeptidase-like regulatory domain-containing protein [bacterium]|nr:carboxypeptidase-like regulatory domain-containing protein [bacterium]
MKRLAFLFIILIQIPTWAAEKTLTGKIIDAKTNEPLAFASIGVKGTSIGTISNSEGKYVLNVQGIAESDTVMISYIGYETYYATVKEIFYNPVVHLKPAAINLQEFQVNSEPLTVEQILERVVERYDSNYVKSTNKQKVFFHKYENAPFPDKNQIVLKRSNFVGLDEKTFNEFYDLMPKEFVEYQDAILELYEDEGKQKLVPVQAISLEESSMKDLSKVLEEKLATFFKDIEETNKTTETYYKFRTGIFSTKVGHKETPDSTWKEDLEDSINYHLSSSSLKYSMNFILKNYASLKGENWEFLNSMGKYNYTLNDLTILNDELVYDISFTPKRRGLFEGRIYVSTQSFAVLQLDYNYAPGKDNENFQLMGLGHSMKYKKGRVIFEKGAKGYYPKYIYAQQNESASIERDFTIKKKQKRFLYDKELNEIKFSTELYFDTEAYWEYLVLDREEIDAETFENVTEPKSVKFKREFAYSPEMWNSTVIAPTSELGKYKRSSSDQP